ncbi:MAG: hypothetical protein ACRD0U_05290 [Acidimicrobiales bacterium]
MAQRAMTSVRGPADTSRRDASEHLVTQPQLTFLDGEAESEGKSMMAEPASPAGEIEPVDPFEPMAFDPAPAGVAAQGPSRSRDRWPFLRPDSPVPTFAGLLITGIGFVLILLAWGQVAGETAVALQLPHIVSGGVVGLALVMVGLLAVTVQSKRQDAAILQRQLEELTAVVTQLAAAVVPAGDERDG